MGAPLVGQERLADSRNIARAVEMQEEHHGWKFRAVMSLEIGGNNSIQPLMAAAHLALPAVDADTMGRAYPEAQMTSVAVGGLCCCCRSESGAGLSEGGRAGQTFSILIEVYP
jgi:DUF917 family protein